MTDILVWQESGGLTNIAQDRTTGLTAAVYPYMQLKPQDIDGDGSVEIPAPETAARRRREAALPPTPPRRCGGWSAGSATAATKARMSTA